ncbi:GntR family transcriptional regulator [Paenibacillus senegalensis]|uniref:GntR family transcriptional regulator n=1 Tax=Paenibacillus senegalensis TaxID=1465766 RepID=UPI0005A65C98|nr:GntR family transcriptional regulator [Paenibacillus senegalensis]
MSRTMSIMKNKQFFMDKQSISQDLVEHIKQLILDGELNMGDRIVETRVAKELGISQTPVREAIRQLCGEGILIVVPNKGPMVRTFDLKDVYEIYSLRAVTEGMAIRLATFNASEQDIESLKQFYEDMKQKEKDDSVGSLLKESLHIHQTIMKLSNHSRLNETYDSISFQISMVNRILGKESTKRKEVEQHQELIDALASRDPEFAEKTMRKHIYRSYSEYVQIQEGVIEHDEQAWF